MDVIYPSECPWVELPAVAPFNVIERSCGSPAPATTLPQELLQHILRMLPHHEDLVHALMTCRSW